MVKVRLMGTKNEIVSFKKILDNNPKVEIVSPSDFYPTYIHEGKESGDQPEKGTSKKRFGYYRHYFSVAKVKK